MSTQFEFQGWTIKTYVWTFNQTVTVECRGPGRNDTLVEITGGIDKFEVCFEVKSSEEGCASDRYVPGPVIARSIKEFQRAVEQFAPTTFPSPEHDGA
jgi:hypothetical protein